MRVLPISLAAATVLVAASALPVQAAVPTKLVDATPAQAAAVIAVLNQEIGGNRPASCFRVKVAASNHRWATWTFSRRAETAPEVCQPFDAGATFYVRRGGTWQQAGGWTGTGEGSVCEWQVRPPASVARDFGC